MTKVKTRFLIEWLLTERSISPFALQFRKEVSSPLPRADNTIHSSNRQKLVKLIKKFKCEAKSEREEFQ
jgi:hypothetical protein